MYLRIGCGVIFSALVCLAAGPVGSVSSSAPFTLRGAPVKVAGVPEWPVLAGDEIVAGTAPAMITFRDGSRVQLNANSRAKVAVTGKQTVLRLTNGQLAYKLSSKSRSTDVAALGFGALPAESSEGLVSINGAVAAWMPAAAGTKFAATAYVPVPFHVGAVNEWKNGLPSFGIPPGSGGNPRPDAPPSVIPGHGRPPISPTVPQGPKPK